MKVYNIIVLSIFYFLCMSYQVNAVTVVPSNHCIIEHRRPSGEVLGEAIGGMLASYFQRKREEQNRIELVNKLKNMGMTEEQAQVFSKVDPQIQKQLMEDFIKKSQQNDDLLQSLLIEIELDKDQQLETLRNLYYNSVFTEEQVQEVCANIQNSPAKQLIRDLPLKIAHLYNIEVLPYDKEKMIKKLQYRKESLERKQQHIDESQQPFIEYIDKKACAATNRLCILHNIDELLKTLSWHDMIWECFKSFIIFLVICVACIRIGYLINASSLGSNTGLVLGLIFTWFMFDFGASALQSNKFSDMDRLRTYLENNIGIENTYSIILPRMIQFIELPNYIRRLKEVNQKDLLKKELKDGIIRLNYNKCPENLDYLVNKCVLGEF